MTSQQAAVEIFCHVLSDFSSSYRLELMAGTNNRVSDQTRNSCVPENAHMKIQQKLF